MSEPYDKLAYAEEFERLRRFRQAYDDAVTAEIQAAAGSTVVRRVADEKPALFGNRAARRRQAARDRRTTP